MKDRRTVFSQSSFTFWKNVVWKRSVETEAEVEKIEKKQRLRTGEKKNILDKNIGNEGDEPEQERGESEGASKSEREKERERERETYK